jgi:hypothetical protein
MCQKANRVRERRHGKLVLSHCNTRMYEVFQVKVNMKKSDLGLGMSSKKGIFWFQVILLQGPKIIFIGKIKFKRYTLANKTVLKKKLA